MLSSIDAIEYLSEWVNELTNECCSLMFLQYVHEYVTVLFSVIKYNTNMNILQNV